MWASVQMGLQFFLLILLDLIRKSEMRHFVRENEFRFGIRRRGKFVIPIRITRELELCLK